MQPDQTGEGRERERRRAERTIGLVLGLVVLAGIALFVVYFLGGQTQAEGALFLVALGGIGLALALWAKRLLDLRDEVEERHELESGPAARAALAVTFEAGAQGVRRRSFLARMLAAAGGALGLSLVLPVLSLGPPVGNTLKRTGWRAGSRVVDENGEPVTVNQVPRDGFATVFPEGEAGRADSQALLIHVAPGVLRLPPERMEWVVNGTHVAYSKICTHAGCPVGLYRAETKSLLCPCHQSQFDVRNGAKPFFGPAAAPLPQLPLGVDEQGVLIALSDFPEPVGPAFWNRTR